jgi:putative ABC transport system permease protein
MRELLARLRSAWRGIAHGSRLDADMDEEMRFHVEMLAERLMRERGLDRSEARRQASVAFGGVEKYKEAGRDTRGVQWIDRVSLDFRLGVRMLVKYPLLTLIGGFAMAVAIAIGATFFEVISEVLNPAIALEEGDRVVALQYATSTPGQPQRRVLPDFVAWRDELRSVQHVSAFRNVDRNLASGSLDPEPVRVAEMTASGFAVARTAPLVGRYLLPDDERDDALPVVVIGHDAWQRRFAGDPTIVGRTITLGAVPHTVVGVMPEGFAFPVNHQFWTALRTNHSAYQRLQGPAIFVFGRLAPGVGLDATQAELTIVGQRAAAADREGYGRLRLTVLPFTREHVEVDRPQIVWALRVVQLLLAALLVVVSVNLAILVYARTVTRLGEIAVRSALGASRRRILAQLFMEALALSAFGAATGLLLSQLALNWLQSMVAAVEYVPFWITFELTIGTIGYAFALAVLAALIVGVLPGLKTTGRRLLTPLRALGASTGMHLGATWTTLIVAQVAIAVAVLPAAFFTVSEVMRMEISGPGFPAEQFVIAKVDVREAEATASGTMREELGDQTRARQLALRARFEAEPGVSAVALSSGVPGFEGGYIIASDDGEALRDGRAEVNVLHVEPGIFEVYGARVLAGRTLVPGDVDPADQAVVVNHSFVRQLLGDRPALGRRFAMPRSSNGSPAPPDRFHVVGVVADFPAYAPAPGSEGQPTMYHAAAPGTMHPVVMTVRFNGPVPSDFARRLRRIGADVDTAVPLRDVMLLTEFYGRNRAPWRFISWGLALVTASVLFLSAAGIYALMSFTVAQRTREIGIRAALGAHPRAILLNVFGRAIRQLGLGVVVGSLAAGAVLASWDLGLARSAALLAAVSAVISMAALLAAIGPARRGLRIQATDALRSDT